LGADGARGIGNALVELIDGAKQEVIIVAYRLTVAVPELTRALESALSRGCLIRIVRDTSGEPVVAEERFLANLLGDHAGLSLWDFLDGTSDLNCALHAKMVIADRSRAIVGSANFSKNGMVKNHEIAVRLEGPEVSSLARACDDLINNGQREGILILRRKDEE
jgi:cardiolipin synthase